MTSRISQCFADAAAKNRAVLGVFVTAGDPDEAISAALLDSLVENGADFVEPLNVFSWPARQARHRPNMVFPDPTTLKHPLAPEKLARTLALQPRCWQKTNQRRNSSLGFHLCGEWRAHVGAAVTPTGTSLGQKVPLVQALEVLMLWWLLESCLNFCIMALRSGLSGSCQGRTRMKRKPSC